MVKKRHIPNSLTILRVILTVFVIYFLLQPDLKSWIIAIICFVVASITDLVDGILARKHGWITTFGKIADPTADKVLTIGTFITFSILHLFSWIWLIPIVIREVLVTVYRFKFVNKGKKVAARKSGKIKTALQMVLLGVMFFVLLFRDQFNYYPTLNTTLIIIMYVLLVVVVILTIYSGARFIRENMYKG